MQQGATMVREVHFDPVGPYVVRLRIKVGGVLLRMTINGPLYLYRVVKSNVPRKREKLPFSLCLP